MYFLFERLAIPPVGAENAPTAEARLQVAVYNQLRWLVGSREWRAEQQGNTLIDAVMPDVPSLPATGREILRYAERLKQLIEQYEPRLLGVRVELLKTGRALSPFRVVVTGRLDAGGPDLNVRFEHEPGPR